MPKVMPFQRTGALINDIDEFFDRCQEAAMLLEKTFLHFIEQGPDESLEQRFDQIRAVERRADELRRGSPRRAPGPAAATPRLREALRGPRCCSGRS